MRGLVPWFLMMGLDVVPWFPKWTVRILSPRDILTHLDLAAVSDFLSQPYALPFPCLMSFPIT